VAEVMICRRLTFFDSSDLALILRRHGTGFPATIEFIRGNIPCIWTCFTNNIPIIDIKTQRRLGEVAATDFFMFKCLGMFFCSIVLSLSLVDGVVLNKEHIGKVKKGPSKGSEYTYQVNVKYT